MLIILCIISILLFAMGTTLLIFSLGYPEWYKQVWKDHIESPVPTNLINLTTLIGSIVVSIGFILMIIYIIKSETPDKKYKKKMIARYGIKEVERLESLKHKTILDKDMDFEGICEIYKQKLKELEL